MKKLLLALATVLISAPAAAQLISPNPWAVTGPQITIGGSSKIALLFGQNGSIVLPRGGAGTFARASTATVTDWEGIVSDVSSGEMRMSGWRRVRNRISVVLSQSKTLSGWSLSGGDVGSGSGNATLSHGADYSTLHVEGSDDRANLVSSAHFPAVGGIYRFSADIYRETSDTALIRLLIYDGAGFVANAQINPPTGQWVRFSVLGTAVTVASSAAAQLQIRGQTAQNTTIRVRNIQIEEVTGQSNQNPSEYVSVGGLSAPYHGVGVDGVKYFATTNGNTVDGSGVVTEAAGLPLHPTYYEPAIKASIWATYKPWAASESTLSAGSRRIPSQTLFPAGGNGYWYYVSTFVGASTGATEPTWPTTIGATVVDATGNTWTNGGYYRIDGYLAEPQRTNLGRFGNDPTNATYWANVDSTPTLNSVQSPDGRTTSTLITEGSAGTAIVAQSVKTITAATRQCMAAWLKRGNTDWVEVGMRNTGATNGFRVWVNLATGAAGTANTFGTATNEAAYVEMKGLNSHWRVVLCGKLAGGDTTAQPYVRSASANGTSTRVNGATYYLWRMQHVTADSITSDIPNDGATDVTRVADSLSFPANSRLNAAGATLAIGRSTLGQLATYPAQVDIVGTGSAGRFLAGASGAANTSVHANDGTSTVSNASGALLPSHQTVGSYWLASALKVAKNNTLAAGSFDGAMAASTISIGGGLGGSELSGAIRSLALLFTPPTDAALQAATQWHNY